MKSFIPRIAALIALSISPLSATLVERSAHQASFNAPITAAALDRFGGLFFVTSSDSTYSIAAAGPTSIFFTPMVPSGSILDGAPVTSLALMASSCAAATSVGVIANIGPITPTPTIAILTLGGSTITTATPLFDAAGVTGALPTKITASPSCFFARVLSPTPDFTGTEPLNSGIATISSSGSIEQGSASTPAVQLDYTSTQARGAGSADLRSLIVNDMQWDNELDTLYIGMFTIAPFSPSGANTGYGIVRGTADTGCTLTLEAITSATPAAGTTTDIFTTRPLANPLTNSSVHDAVNIHRIRVMHTSTGLDYLIINGSSLNSTAYLVNNSNQPPTTTIPVNNTASYGDVDTTGNLIFALPLGTNTSNPAAPGAVVNPVQGQIVENIVTSTLQTLRCTGSCTQCISSVGGALTTSLANDFNNLSSNCAYEVGGGAAPWQANLPPANNVYAGTSVAYFFRAADSTIVSNSEDPAAGTAAAPNPGYTLIVNLVQNQTLVQTTQPASDLFIVGDTVYVSAGNQTSTVPLILNFGATTRIISVPVTITSEASSTNSVGIWASHAQFDCSGIITGWTGWERIFPTSGGDDGAAQFAVDGATGKIWKVDNTHTTVHRTDWETINGSEGTLPTALNNALGGTTGSQWFGCSQQCSTCGTTGVFTILDIVSATTNSGFAPGFDGTTSYALFGGFERVAFARTSNASSMPTPPNAYNIPANFLLTRLPGTGAITSLAYSNRQNSNVFFAGTSNGLYVYAHENGTAFDTSATPFDALDSSPFATTDTWFLIPGTACQAVTTLAVDNGSNLYFVVQDTTSCECFIVDKLYRISLSDLEEGGGVGSLAPILIAQSGNGSIPTNALFSGFTLVSSPCNPQVLVQLFGLISTNNGAYISSLPLDEMTLDSSWTLVPRTSCLAFNFLTSSAKQPIFATTAWALSPRDTIRNCKPLCQGTFEESGIMQFAGCLPATTTAGITTTPDFFEPTLNEPRFFTSNALPITSIPQSIFMWSDGGRRFFITPGTSACSPSTITSLPFESSEWNLSAPIGDANLSSTGRINWIANLSGSGLLVAGTDQGIIRMDA